MAVDLESFAYSFQHAIIKVAETQFTAISNVTFSQAIERSAVMGTLRKPLKRSAGQGQLGEGSLTFSDLKEALNFFAALGADPSSTSFVIDVTLANSNGDTDSFELLGCNVSSFSANFEAGADALGLEQAFTFMSLKINTVEFIR